MQAPQAPTSSTDRLRVRQMEYRSQQSERRGVLTDQISDQDQELKMPPPLLKVHRCRNIMTSVIFLLVFCSLIFLIGDVPSWIKLKKFCSSYQLRENATFYLITGLLRLVPNILVQIIYIMQCCFANRIKKNRWLSLYRRQKYFCYFYILLFSFQTIVANIYLLPQFKVPDRTIQISGLDQCQKRREIYRVDLFAQFVILQGRNLLMVYFLFELLVLFSCQVRKKLSKGKLMRHFLCCIFTYGQMPMDYLRDFQGCFMKNKEFQQTDVMASDEVCLICLEGFKYEERVYRLPCKPRSAPHYFHSLCLNKWAQEQMSCPKCRKLFAIKNAHDVINFVSPNVSNL